MFQWDQRFCIKRKVQCYEDAANEVAHTEANVYYYTEKNTIMLVKSFEFVKKKKIKLVCGVCLGTLPYMTASKLFCTTLPPQFLTGIALFSCIGLRIHVPPKANWFKAQSVYLRVEYVLSFTTVLCKLCFWIRFYREFTNSVSPNNDLNVVKHQLPMFTFIRWCVQVYSQPWFCQE